MDSEDQPVSCNMVAAWLALWNDVLSRSRMLQAEHTFLAKEEAALSA
jgi:hypothetical protein